MTTAGIQHKESTCPRCGESFHCNVVDVGKCQCHGFKPDELTSRFISEKYSDCLCLQCLQDLNQQIPAGEKPGAAK